MVGDNLNQFGDNLSGLTYEPASSTSPAVLWAVLNGPGTLYRLLFDGTVWTADATADWNLGKTLRYPSGTGNPDSESVARGEYAMPFIYVSTERNNDASGVSRLSVLRFDTSAAGSTLVATHEWNLTGDLPSVGANLGLEGITWAPDSVLVARQFYDESKGGLYDPAAYPDHGTGLFFLGVEGTGLIYAYALDHGASAAFQKIATIASGHAGVMGIEFDRDTGALWAACDNTCAGTQHVLGIVSGRFQLRRAFARPSTLPDSNNEGIAFATESECAGGFKRFFWSDDSRFGGHALRMDAIPCGSLF